MKNLMNKILAMTAIASMAFLFSCGDEDLETPAPALPTISVSTTVNGTAATSPLTVYPGDSVGFSVAITAEGGFDSYVIYQSVDGGTATRLVTYTRLDLDVPVGTSIVSDGVGTIVEASSVGSTITFEFEVVDDASQTNTTSVEMMVKSPEARLYAGTKLLAPAGDGTNKNFFSVATGTLYSKSEVNATTAAISPMIDFGYYYGTSDFASIASPAGFETTVFSSQVSGWGTKNATTLKTTSLTATQFTELSTFADVESAVDGGTLDSNGIISGLTVGQVLAFETVGGVKGLIHVAAIEPGFESNDYIQLDIIAMLDAQ